MSYFSSGGVPIPGRKPNQILNTVSGDGSSILGTIWDTTRNVFNRVIDFELQTYEAEQIAKLRGAESFRSTQKDQEYLTGSTIAASQPGGLSMSNLATIGIMGIAAVLLAR